MGDQQAVLMEQVSMYMAALPCPPLPLIVKQEISEDEEREVYKNSHDLIATLLLGAMGMGAQDLNQLRQKKQMDMTEKLLSSVRAAQGDIPKAYTAFMEFTAGYICAFMNIDVAVTFMPLDRVEKNDTVHKNTCSWHKAQEVILLRHKQNRGTRAAKPEEQKAIDAILATDFSHMSYEELLRAHCQRFVDE
jgi:hypothetical protein